MIDDKLAAEAITIAEQEDEIEKLAAVVAELRALRDDPSALDGLSPRQLAKVRKAAQKAEDVAFGVRIDAERNLGKALIAMRSPVRAGSRDESTSAAASPVMQPSEVTP